MLLAIDTSLTSSVAVVDDDGRVLAERDVDDTRRHAEVIGGLIVDALAAAGVAPAAITAVVAGIGPGPFTGLRIGIAAARAFALGRGVPLLAVPSHDAVALDEAAGGGPLVVTTDARRRERARTEYDGVVAGVPARRGASTLVAADAADAAESGGARRVDAERISAGALGRVAAAMIATGAPFPGPEPLYLRPPDVTVGGPAKRVRR